MFQIIQLQQEREALMDTHKMHRKKVKESFDKKIKKDGFVVGDLVLRWDAPKEDKGKHGKFDYLCIRPFTVH